ncbi:hypothetical protein [Sediminicoccus sp. KRV36]|uniref:hypothetical protein n=1 Tax=Sediminicoccus sp. KRV36 TaxID=3133721 RepID=UPI00200EB7AC|nr:hypothetical protein [Sediminicoccus rosea]UPY36793.1 hypothetical protein LHU95_21670 [Sediminicoccus rosea]
MAHSVKRKTLLFGFLCGAISVIAFHQTTQLLLHYHAAKLPILIEWFGQAPQPYNFAPVAPWGVPAIASQAFWGGLWGVLLAILIRYLPFDDLPFGFIFGALALTATAVTLVAQLKDLPLYASGNQQTLLRIAFLNGAWGFGTAFLLRPFAVRG